MKIIWNICNNRISNIRLRDTVFIIFNILLFAILGLVLGIILITIFKMSSTNQIITVICSIGYPAFFLGAVGGLIYLMIKE